MVENKEVYARQHPPAIHQFINSDFHNYQIGTYKKLGAGSARRRSSQHAMRIPISLYKVNLSVRSGPINLGFVMSNIKASSSLFDYSPFPTMSSTNVFVSGVNLAHSSIHSS